MMNLAHTKHEISKMGCTRGYCKTVCHTMVSATFQISLGQAGELFDDGFNLPTVII
jgi:hypothetical protein